jgi:hypothetical protein
MMDDNDQCDTMMAATTWFRSSRCNVEFYSIPGSKTLKKAIKE